MDLECGDLFCTPQCTGRLGGLGSDLLGAWVYLHDVAVAFASRESSRPAVELGNNEVGTPMRRPFVGDGEYAG